MMDGKEKVMMKVGGLLLTTPLTRITILTVVEITAHAKPCNTTPTANPLHPVVTVDIVSLRHIQKLVPAQCTAPGSSRSM